MDDTDFQTLVGLIRKVQKDVQEGLHAQKKEIQALHGGMQKLHDDLQALKFDVNAFKMDFHAHKTEMYHRLDHIEGKVDDLYCSREKVKMKFGWRWGFASLIIAVVASGIVEVAV